MTLGVIWHAAACPASGKYRGPCRPFATNVPSNSNRNMAATVLGERYNTRRAGLSTTWGKNILRKPVQCRKQSHEKLPVSCVTVRASLKDRLWHRVFVSVCRVPQQETVSSHIRLNGYAQCIPHLLFQDTAMRSGYAPALPRCGN